MIYCSFCGSSQWEVSHIIAGPQVNICVKCVEFCVELLMQEGYEPTSYRWTDDDYYCGA